jgi:hypothetical protein
MNNKEAKMMLTDPNWASANKARIKMNKANDNLNNYISDLKDPELKRLRNELSDAKFRFQAELAYIEAV